MEEVFLIVLEYIDTEILLNLYNTNRHINKLLNTQEILYRLTTKHELKNIETFDNATCFDANDIFNNICNYMIVNI
jgi:hypothetical protein